MARKKSETRQVKRLRSSDDRGFPLRRTLLVTFNREKRRVTADLGEVSEILDIRGMGTDEKSSFRDLERQFEQMVREKVRVPPHTYQKKHARIREFVNSLVDWEQFQCENPLPRLLWGQHFGQSPAGAPMIKGLCGPGGVRNRKLPLPPLYMTPCFDKIPEKAWFRGVVIEYPDRVEWIERP